MPEGRVRGAGRGTARPKAAAAGIGILLAGLALAACGGGGGGGGGGGSALPAPSGRGPVVEGYDNQWGLRAVDARAAWGNLETRRPGEDPGHGVRVGVIDSPIYGSHFAFAGVDLTTEQLDGTRSFSGDLSHGTAVAGVIAAGVDPDWVDDDTWDSGEGGGPGLAWGATVLGYGIDTSGGGSGPYEPVTLGTTFRDRQRDEYWEDLAEEVLDDDLDVLNLSIGFEGTIDDYTEAQIRASLPKFLAALAQADRTDDEMILVWAAGNGRGAPHVGGGDEDGSHPEVFPGLMVEIDELRSHSVAVVAVDGNGRIAGFSNRCGKAANWCLAAPGVNIRTVAYAEDVYHDGEFHSRIGGWVEQTGTSFAAPHVTGALALMKHMFGDTLSSEELLTRMYRTAYKAGEYANRSVYGQGLLDVGAATNPVGTMSGSTGRTVDGPGVPLASSLAEAGPAMGDALRRALSGREAAGFDELGAPFWFDLGALAAAPAGPDADARLAGFVAGKRAGPGHLTAAAGRDGRTIDGGRVSWALSGDGRSGGLGLSWSADGGEGGGAVFRAGAVLERRGALGWRSEGVFGGLASGGVFVGGSVSGALGAWVLDASGEMGWSEPRPDGGWLRDVSGVLAGALSLRGRRDLGLPAGRPLAVELSLEQPLRVESGTATFRVATGRTRDRRVVYESFDADLRPSGRELALGVALERGVGAGSPDGGALRLGMTWTREPGHVRGAKPDLMLMGGGTLRW